MKGPSIHLAHWCTGALALVVAAACSGGDGAQPGPADLAVLPPDLIGADLKDTDYPPGPYAQTGTVNPGDVIPDFTFQGYFSPSATTGRSSAQPFGEVTLGMIRDAGARYAIIDLAAFW